MTLPTWDRDSHAMFQAETLQGTYTYPNNLHTLTLNPQWRQRVAIVIGWDESWRRRPGLRTCPQEAIGGPTMALSLWHLFHCPFTLHLPNTNTKIKILGIQYGDCRTLSPSVSSPLRACTVGPPMMLALRSR